MNFFSVYPIVKRGEGATLTSSMGQAVDLQNAINIEAIEIVIKVERRGRWIQIEHMLTKLPRIRFLHWWLFFSNLTSERQVQNVTWNNDLTTKSTLFSAIFHKSSSVLTKVSMLKNKLYQFSYFAIRGIIDSWRRQF